MNPSFCNDKWCSTYNSVYGVPLNKGGNTPVPSTFPATGMDPLIAACGSVQAMMYDRRTRGGLTGRGVTPCNFGFYERSGRVAPWHGSDLNVLFFDLGLPSYVPPQLDPRPLTRVGYTLRN